LTREGVGRKKKGKGGENGQHSASAVHILSREREIGGTGEDKGPEDLLLLSLKKKGGKRFLATQRKKKREKKKVGPTPTLSPPLEKKRGRGGKGRLAEKSMEEGEGEKKREKPVTRRRVFS